MPLYPYNMILLAMNLTSACYENVFFLPGFLIFALQSGLI
jgi:hypothetical protein